MLQTKLSVIICVLLLAVSCKTVEAPRGSVPKRKALATDARGGWLIVTTSDLNSHQGEFICHTDTMVYVMTETGTIEIPKEKIDEARLIIYYTNTFSYGLWTFLGSISTLSNGGFLIFTFPAWYLTGVPTMMAESDRENYYDYPQKTWNFLGVYARFPQGKPKGVDLFSLTRAN